MIRDVTGRPCRSMDRSYTGWWPVAGAIKRVEHGGHDSLEMAMNPWGRFGILLAFFQQLAEQQVLRPILYSVKGASQVVSDSTIIFLPLVVSYRYMTLKLY